MSNRMGRPRKNKEKTASKAKFSFIHSRRGDNNLELLINFGYSVRKYISAKIKVPKSAWNDAEQEVIKQYPNSEKINDYLQHLKSKYEGIELDLMTKGEPFTPETLEKALNDNGGRIVDYFRKKISVEIDRQLYAEDTVKHLYTLCNVLENFEKESCIFVYAACNGC